MRERGGVRHNGRGKADEIALAARSDGHRSASQWGVCGGGAGRQVGVLSLERG